MSNINLDAILALAASKASSSKDTPRDNSKSSKASRPFTRSQALSPDPASSSLDIIDTAKHSTRKAQRKRSPNFVVYCDPLTSSEPTDTATKSEEPTVKRAKVVARMPLSRRSSSSTNSTPMPSPRTPDTPYPLSFADPLWENIENYEPQAATPNLTSSLDMPSGTTPYLMGPSLGPPPRHATRALRARPARSPRLPRSMEVYTLLGLQDWTVTREEIRAAYRRAALEQHPDHANNEERSEATLKMQQLNAARDLLLNERTRRQYHIDGKVPWANVV